MSADKPGGLPIATLLRGVEQAMRDEGIDTRVRDRVIARLVYGTPEVNHGLSGDTMEAMQDIIDPPDHEPEAFWEGRTVYQGPPEVHYDALTAQQREGGS